MDSGDPIDPREEAASGTPRRPASSRLIVLLVVAVALVAAGFLVFRRAGGNPGAPAAGSATSTPPPGLNVVVAPVKLSSKAMLVADRFQCLCGECQDTLGKCTCTRDKGSNDMKTALNRIVEEKATLSEIEAAMVGKFGPGVLASSNPPAQPSSK